MSLQRRNDVFESRDKKRFDRSMRGLYESARQFNEAFDKVFCRHRPWMRSTGESGFTATFGRRPQAGKELQRRIARGIVAMGDAKRGLIFRIAKQNGLKPENLYAAVFNERRRQLKAGRLAA